MVACFKFSKSNLEETLAYAGQGRGGVGSRDGELRGLDRG